MQPPAAVKAGSDPGHKHFLRIDHIDVPLCSCGTGGPHWAVIDIERALARRLAAADIIELWDQEGAAE